MSSQTKTQRERVSETPDNSIAVVGMGLRFPGANSPQQYWQNLANGVRSIRDFSPAELQDSRVNSSTLANPNYVPSSGTLDDFDRFDAEFFGFSPKEAAIMDPQHRKFLQVCWEALEDSTHRASSFDGAIGVFAGCGMNSYFMFNLLQNRAVKDSVGLFLLRHTGNDKDFLTTRVSYCLNLTGPSVSVQTACSTSLVAIHTAAQSLLSGECDMALAGGVTIEIPHGHGYLYREGEVLSPDGHCRAFDANAKGTVFGSGAGAVVLRRLEDALVDGDRIYSVIRGSAINNDGSGKAGYLAPSVDQQAAAAVEALAIADIDASTIGYVAAHGTGTPIGDPIEIAALTEAFNETTQPKQRKNKCVIGSVKPNIGHLDCASGVASFICASLAIHNNQLPPSIDYDSPNPSIDFESSPFVVGTEKNHWPDIPAPRRALVNSLGVGGTNANVILEEAPSRMASDRVARPHQLFAYSANSKQSLEEYTVRLCDRFETFPDKQTCFADGAFTLAIGREAFKHRRVVVASDSEEAASMLRKHEPNRVFTHTSQSDIQAIAFLFPGGGSQYLNMGLGLYQTEKVFRDIVDRGSELLKQWIGVDVRKLCFPGNDGDENAELELEKPSIQLPTIFLWEMAIARLWMSRGVIPTSLVGHSMGENTAGCLAGVFEFEDALRLVALRGELLERVPQSCMVSVAASPDALEEYLGADLDLAVVNSAEMCVVSGNDEAVDQFSQKMKSSDIDAKRIPIRIAAHSRLLDPVLHEFCRFVEGLSLSVPSIPFMSNLTGQWITDAQAKSAEYWTRQLRETVRFSDCVNTVAQKGKTVFLETGPGKILSGLVRQNLAQDDSHIVLSSTRHASEHIDDAVVFETTRGRLWAAGFDIDLAEAWKDEKRHRITMPTYAFQHDRYWIDPDSTASDVTQDVEPLQKQSEIERWFSTTQWQEDSIRDALAANSNKHEESPGIQTWLIFLDDAEVGKQIVKQLNAQGDSVITVVPGDFYYRASEREYRIVPELGGDQYRMLVDALEADGVIPDNILYLWPVTADRSHRPGSTFLLRTQEQGVIGLTLLMQSLDAVIQDRRCLITVVTNSTQSVLGESIAYPEKATSYGPTKVAPREYPNLQTQAIDIDLDDDLGCIAELLLRVSELADKGELRAIRDGKLYRQSIRSVDASGVSDSAVRLRRLGTYLITGGFGAIGYSVSKYLAENFQANLVILARNTVQFTSRRQKQIEKLRSLGARITVVKADVANENELRLAIEMAEAEMGIINGVFHTAGQLRDDLIATSSAGSIQQSLATKLYGTLLLDEVFTEHQLDFFALCSSTSTFLAPAGQSAYVAANCFLNAFAQSQAGVANYPVVAINWGVWKHIGMGAAAYEKLIGARIDEDNNDRCRYEVRQSITGHFDSIAYDDDSGTWCCNRTLRASKDWFLNEHRSPTGQAVVPATAYTQLLASALAEAGEAIECHGIELLGLTYLEPCIVDDDVEKELMISVVPRKEGYECEIFSRRSTMTRWISHCVATAMVIDSESGVCTCNCEKVLHEERSQPLSRCTKTHQSELLRFGPRWDCYRSIEYFEDRAVASLELSEAFRNECAEYPLHPALLDMATGFGLPLSSRYDDDSGLFVPAKVNSIRISAPLVNRVRATIRLSKSLEPTNTQVCLDVDITDTEGRQLVEITELTMQAVQTKTFGLNTSQSVMADGGEQQTDFGVEKRDSSNRLLSSISLQSRVSLNEAENLFAESYQLGIEPDEGPRAFEKSLAYAALGDVYVSPVPVSRLQERIQRISEVTPESSLKFDRPSIENDFDPPTTRTEKALAKIWGALLGIEAVGIADNFFDSGGHSLLAARMVRSISQQFGVDLPLVSLIKSPTVKLLASEIDTLTGSETVRGNNQDPAETYRYLVPLNDPKNSVRPPLFIVGGMFGNVLNLRHLAKQLGEEQKVFGIQAKGLLGDDEPHHTFEEMAKDYLNEIRRVQPEGPYFLSGFSGGGISAYEMAIQLLQAGEEVGMLVLLDTPAVHGHQLRSIDRIKIHFDLIRRKRFGYLRHWWNSRQRWQEEMREAQQRREMKRDEVNGVEFRSEIVQEAFMESHAAYRTPVYDGIVHLIRPVREVMHHLPGGRRLVEDRVFEDEYNFWRPFIRGGIRLHHVTGDHNTMVLEPHVRHLAEVFKQCIDEACQERIRTNQSDILPLPTSPTFHSHTTTVI